MQATAHGDELRHGAFMSVDHRASIRRTFGFTADVDDGTGNRRGPRTHDRDRVSTLSLRLPVTVKKNVTPSNENLRHRASRGAKLVYKTITSNAWFIATFATIVVTPVMLFIEFRSFSILENTRCPTQSIVISVVIVMLAAAFYFGIRCVIFERAIPAIFVLIPATFTLVVVSLYALFMLIPACLNNHTRSQLHVASISCSTIERLGRA
jgi:hypothetical protein